MSLLLMLKTFLDPPWKGIAAHELALTGVHERRGRLRYREKTTTDTATGVGMMYDWPNSINREYKHVQDWEV